MNHNNRLIDDLRMHKSEKKKEKSLRDVFHLRESGTASARKLSDVIIHKITTFYLNRQRYRLILHLISCHPYKDPDKSYRNNPSQFLFSKRPKL